MSLPNTNVKSKTGLLVANFGGPRSKEEVSPFLVSLLCDQEVLRTPLPAFLHKALFTRIAKKRAKKVAEDYEAIGGKSPIFEDTENVASALRTATKMPVATYHRYLPATHQEFIQTMSTSAVEKWLIFPMFPQFSYSTTGSIAKWFSKNLPKSVLQKISWVKSYPDAPPYVDLFEKRIRAFIEKTNIPEDQWLLFFSAHGLPQKYVDTGDPYEEECNASFEAIQSRFTKCQSLLAYQSKFGPGQWLKPYTIDVCQTIDQISDNKQHVLFIPMAFTSDHIETLFEIETEYMPVVEEKGLTAHRLPAFNDKSDWIAAIKEIINAPRPHIYNRMLLR